MNIPYGRQHITKLDIEAVVEALTSPLITQGPLVPSFEFELAEQVGAKYGTAVNSATSALHIAVMALGLKRGDLVWTTPITFVASANCALYCGARVDFVDINTINYTMCVEALEAKLINAQRTGDMPKIVIPVHLAGHSADMEKIYRLSKRFDFKIVEDASHAIGGKYKNQMVGCGEFSDITIFSFHPVKIITTAEGGMAVTNDKQIADKMALLRSHGIVKDLSEVEENAQGAWFYDMRELGYNYRMTELQAALGKSQLKGLVENIAERNRIADIYHEMLSDLNITLPTISDDCLSAFHLYILLFENEKERAFVFERLRDKGIGVNVHYIPVHYHSFYKNLGFKIGDFPIAENYYSRAMSIPMYPGLTLGQQEFVCNAIKEALA